MLRREALGGLDGLGLVAGDEQPAVPQRGRGDGPVGLGKLGEAPGQGFVERVGEAGGIDVGLVAVSVGAAVPAIDDDDRGHGRDVVFGLGQEVGGGDLGIGSPSRYHEELGGPGRRLRADDAREKALGRGGVPAAWANDDVAGGQSGAEREGSDALSSAGGQEAFGSAQGRGREGRARRLGTCAPDGCHARRLCRAGGHDGARGQRKTASRGVATRPRDRSKDVAGPAAGNGDIDVAQRGALGLREGEYAVAGSLEQAPLGRRQRGQRGFHALASDDQRRVAAEPVQLFGPFPHGGLATRCHVRDDARGGLLGLGVAGPRARLEQLPKARPPKSGGHQCPPESWTKAGLGAPPRRLTRRARRSSSASMAARLEPSAIAFVSAK